MVHYTWFRVVLAIGLALLALLTIRLHVAASVLV